MEQGAVKHSLLCQEVEMQQNLQTKFKSTYFKNVSILQYPLREVNFLALTLAQFMWEELKSQHKHCSHWLVQTLYITSTKGK